MEGARDAPTINVEMEKYDRPRKAKIREAQPPGGKKVGEEYKFERKYSARTRQGRRRIDGLLCGCRMTLMIERTRILHGCSFDSNAI